MKPLDAAQLALFVGILAIITKPLGLFLVRVLDANGRTWLDPVVGPLERLTYRVLGIRSPGQQDWRQYTASMLSFSLISCVFSYTILRLQDRLPLNPQAFAPMSDHLAFNTAVSFTTNTNWQSYVGEATLSYFSQMVALTLHNFTSAAVGIAIAAALVRGLVGSSVRTLGNFWVDLIRITYYLLLPATFVFALFLVSQGVVQNFNRYTHAKLSDPFTVQVPLSDSNGAPVTTNVVVTVHTAKLQADGTPVLKDGAAVWEDVPVRDGNGGIVRTNQPVMVDQKVEEQVVAQGPVASQAAIKMLGTNGGGFMNANAAHPFENPTPLSNFVQMLSIFAIGSALTYYLGRVSNNQAHGWSVWTAMMVLFLAGTAVCWWAEARGNPIHQALGIAGDSGNMEGKEVRFGIFNSALFATITTDASCGAVNSMHDSFTALGGLIPIFNMQLGEVVFGGVGAGIYGMLVFVVLGVFIAGLMVGRTPEYLGKKIQAYEVKMAMLALLVLTLSTLGFTAWAAISPWGLAGLNNSGPHGFSEIFYAYSSANANNGSAFGGLSANTPWYNITLGLAMLVGRFLMIVPILAMAGSMARKRTSPPSLGTFPVSGTTFVILLIGTVLLVGALNYLPGLALGPIVEHFLTGQSQLF